MGQCSRRSLIEAKAHEPKPVVAIKRTSSCAWAMATSNGGFLGLLFDSKRNLFKKENSICKQKCERVFFFTISTRRIVRQLIVNNSIQFEKIT